MSRSSGLLTLTVLLSSSCGIGAPTIPSGEYQLVGTAGAAHGTTEPADDGFTLYLVLADSGSSRLLEYDGSAIPDESVVEWTNGDARVVVRDMPSPGQATAFTCSFADSTLELTPIGVRKAETGAEFDSTGDDYGRVRELHARFRRCDTSMAETPPDFLVRLLVLEHIRKHADAFCGFMTAWGGAPSIESIEIVQRGAFNATGGYWPLRVHARFHGECQEWTMGATYRSQGRKAFDRTLECRIFRHADDYGSVSWRLE